MAPRQLHSAQAWFVHAPQKEQYLQHSWHNGQVREVPRELGLVVGDALDAHDALAGFEMQDLVHESERVSVRENLENVLRHGEDGLWVRDASADIEGGRFLGLLFRVVAHPQRGACCVSRRLPGGRARQCTRSHDEGRSWR